MKELRKGEGEKSSLLYRGSKAGLTFTLKLRVLSSSSLSYFRVSYFSSALTGRSAARSIDAKVQEQKS